MFDRPRKLRKHRKSKTWKLLRIHDYKSLIQPCVSAISILGFFPYKTEASKYVFSRGRFVWSMFMMILFTCGCLLTLYHLNSHNKIYKELVSQLRCNFSMFPGPLLLPLNYITNGSKLQMLQKLSDVSRILSPQIFRRMAKGMFIKDLVTLAVLCMYLPFVIIGDFVLNFVFFYTLLVMLLLYMLYVNSIYVLEACLKNINESLMKLRKTLITDEPHLLRRVYHMKKNRILIRNVKTLRERHLQIGEVVQLCNDSFGFVIIGTLGMALFEITFNIYDYVNMSLNNTGFNVWFTINFILTIYYSGNLIRMASICESAKDEAKKIGSNIHQNLVTTFDEQLSAELELFSVQVLQQDNSFSAMGLTIDATLLTKMASSITTYLLILIQLLLLKPC